MTAVVTSTADRPPRSPIAGTIVVRVVVPAAALALAAMHLSGGEQSLPTWLWKLAVRANVDGITAVRLLAAFDAALALVILASPRLARPTATLAVLLLAFSAVAEISALVSDRATASAFATPILALAGAGVLGAAISRLAPRPSTPRAIGPGTILGPLAALLFTLGAAARLPVADRPRQIPAAWAAASSEVLFSDLPRLVGRTPAEAGLSRYQPQLTALTLEGRSVVVFYNPHCGDCSELFRAAFSGDAHPEVIAVEVPPPAAVLAAVGEAPADVECPECRRLTLQSGPQYFAKLPVVMVIENGKIRCVEQKNPERCLDR